MDCEAHLKRRQGNLFVKAGAASGYQFSLVQPGQSLSPAPKGVICGMRGGQFLNLSAGMDQAIRRKA
jgi:hypothetical protein